MTFQELQKFSERPFIEWRAEKENFQSLDEVEFIDFKNTSLAWYNETPERATRFTSEKLKTMTADELDLAIRKGVDVDGITRITGYFAKTKNFNPGKQGEMQDRVRQGLGGQL